MSDIAFAFAIYPNTYSLVALLQRRRWLPARPSRVERSAIDEGIRYLSEELAEVVRQSAKGQTAEELAAAMDSAELDADFLGRAAKASGDPGTVFRITLDAGLADVDKGIDDEVRAIILSAPTGGPRRKRGRPRTPPDIVTRAEQLQGEGLSYKEIARRLRDESQADLSREAVRDLLKPRRKKRG